MPTLVIHGALLRCSEGTAPCTLSVPTGREDVDEDPIATVADHKPFTNIAPFGLCTTLANPKVASATASASGVLTPMPCEPVVSAPWMPGSSHVNVLDTPALTDDSTCTCQWTGFIEIIDSCSPVKTD